MLHVEKRRSPEASRKVWKCASFGSAVELTERGDSHDALCLAHLRSRLWLDNCDEDGICDAWDNVDIIWRMCVLVGVVQMEIFLRLLKR
jgi:hypothetical protein